MESVFDSDEEEEFHAWCVEAVAAGFLKSFEYHPKPFELCAKATIPVIKRMKRVPDKRIDQFVFASHQYTADFLLHPTGKLGTFSHKMQTTNDSYWEIGRASCRERV